MIINEEITAGHARAILALESEDRESELQEKLLIKDIT